MDDFNNPQDNQFTGADSNYSGTDQFSSSGIPNDTYTSYPDPGMSNPYPNPSTGAPKSKMTAGLLGLFLGGWGVHRFYLGYTTMGIIQIVVTLVTCGIGSLWGCIEGILILCGSTITTDANGNPLAD